MPIKVPTTLPMLEKKKTKRIWVILFLKNPFMLNISSGKCSKSETLGFRSIDSSTPVNSPTPTVGLIEVMGAATKASKTVRGWAKAISAPIEERVPFTTIHFQIMEILKINPDLKNPVANSPNIKSGAR